MALVACPECGRDISDKVKLCPHCGYPLAEDPTAATPSQPVSVTSIKLDVDPARKKKVVTIATAIALSAAIIVCVAVGISSSKKSAARTQYIDNITEVRTAMLLGAAQAEEICNLTNAVWYNTIYKNHSSETDAYTQSVYGYFNSDFNTSLEALYSAEDTKGMIAKIESNQKLVLPLMTQLQNPTDEFRSCYETLENMYDTYQGLTTLAISPTGSYNSFSEKTRTYGADFLSYYKKIVTQIPEKTAE